jgi:formate hydrogenlyase subunit 4
MTDQMTSMVLICGAVLLAPFIGGLLAGIDRIFTARLQGRIGPPLLQPFYDFFKLMGKEQIAASKMQLVWMYSYLMLMIACLVFLFLGQDILLLIFLLGFAGVCLALGGFSTKSPYSHFGANRELLQMLAYEPILILLALAVYVKNGTFMISKIWESQEPLLFSLWPIFIAFVVILTIKFRKSPFDISCSHHAHQEIVKGVITEYSGPYYALFLLAEWYETVLLLCLVGLFWANPWWIGAIMAVGIFLLEMIIDNIAARMTAGWMIKFSWVLGLVLCASNIAYLYFKKGVF